jgi:hypothetical protein
MALDDVGANSRRLAEAIHGQLGEGTGAVPVYDIARALDIEEIREEPLRSFEAALVTTPERDRGSVLLNSTSSPQRRRFSLGHELGHFLNSWHRPSAVNGFRCTRLDMTAAESESADQHRRQEAEANTFSIELLAPRKRLRSYLSAQANLKHILRMAGDLDISREAAARRYVELHDDNLAAVFAHKGSFTYAVFASAFPPLSLRKRSPVRLVGDPREERLSDIEEVDPLDWLRRPDGFELDAQTFHQQNSFSITLLRVSRSADDDDLGIDDAYDRFERDDERRR